MVLVYYKLVHICFNFYPFQYADEFYREMQGLFHPSDTNYLGLLEHMYEKIISSSNVDDERKWNKAMGVAQEIMEAYEKLYPPYDINTALFALKLGKIASYLEKNKNCRGMDLVVLGDL